MSPRRSKPKPKKTRSGNWRKHFKPGSGSMVVRRNQSAKPKETLDNNGGTTPPPRTSPPIVVLPGGPKPVVRATLKQIRGVRTGTLTNKRAGGQARPTGRPQGIPVGGAAPLGYLHGKFLSPSGTGMARASGWGSDWLYPGAEANQLVGLKDDGVFGVGFSFWFRTTGNAANGAGTGYAYDTPTFSYQMDGFSSVYCPFGVRIVSPPYGGAPFIGVGTDQVGTSFDGGDMTYQTGEPRMWWGASPYTAYGADHNKWFFLHAQMCVYYGTGTRTYLRLYLGDLDGNWCSAGYGASKKTPYTGFNRGQAASIGVYFRSNQNQQRRWRGDICQLRTFWTKSLTDSGSRPYSNDFWNNGEWLKPFDYENETSLIHPSYGWSIRGYWPLAENGEIDNSIMAEDEWDFELGQDGEFRNPDNGYEDGPEL